MIDHLFAWNIDQWLASRSITPGVNFSSFFYPVFSTSSITGFFFLIDSPCSTSLCALCTSLSRIASAVVGGSISPYHLSTGNWLITMVLLCSYLSYTISNRSLHCWFVRGSSPRSYRINTTVFYSNLSCLSQLPSTRPWASVSNRRPARQYWTLCFWRQACSPRTLAIQVLSLPVGPVMRMFLRWLM